ncbi:hypothetical protein HYH03_012177 [Edaphochlamys debaryana]|uniref:Uncharacterized protein n=1 Tax=Edaphochlamys debaryana TaxID=47281 RepID=A0A835XQP2_9CHLO|nr:hypothetical protein HYH03_012177 [Edaphochlamys debaryana]|eukprot:KAG2489347.1 hypothetical protein HYH03_012177 [Edaphochlamys debaryana]
MATLAQRQWRQRAQTAVRVATTASKEARSRFQALSDGGDAAMSELANTALQLSHLPSLRLPGPLAEMRPDVRAAAAAKLARQQEALLAALQDRVGQLGSCVEALRGAVATLEEVPQDEPWMRNTPVFLTMPLARVRQLVTKVYDMYRQEYDSKAAVVQAMGALLVFPSPEAMQAASLDLSSLALSSMSAAGTGLQVKAADPMGRAMLAELSKRGEAEGKRLPDLCTTYISVWMLGPYLEEEQAEEALAAVTEDMVGF